MENYLHNFYLQKEEPIKGCLLSLRDIILAHNKDITSALKYGMPFFCYKGKMFCYLWVHKKHKQPYLGMVEGKLIKHERLIIEKRARMKIILFDPVEDLPMKAIKSILKQAIDLYKTGAIKIKEKA